MWNKSAKLSLFISSFSRLIFTEHPYSGIRIKKSVFAQRSFLFFIIVVGQIIKDHTNKGKTTTVKKKKGQGCIRPLYKGRGKRFKENDDWDEPRENRG